MTKSRSADRTERRQTMADVSHVHRYDPGASARVYSRGPMVTDGGEPHENETRDEETAEDEAEDERETTSRRMKDVSHTPPTGDQEVNRVFERGAEGREVDDE